MKSQAGEKQEWASCKWHPATISNRFRHGHSANSRDVTISPRQASSEKQELKKSQHRKQIGKEMDTIQMDTNYSVFAAQEGFLSRLPGKSGTK